LVVGFPKDLPAAVARASYYGYKFEQLATIQQSSDSCDSLSDNETSSSSSSDDENDVAIDPNDEFCRVLTFQLEDIESVNALLDLSLSLFHIIIYCYY
jgi:hypothetical protein